MCSGMQQSPRRLVGRLRLKKPGDLAQDQFLFAVGIYTYTVETNAGYRSAQKHCR